MHRTRKLFATTMIAAAGAVSAAVAFSGTATAQPAPAPAPAPSPEVPGLPFLQQLAANPAAATQLMQGFANLMGNATTTPPATAATTPATPVAGPGATASISLPQPADVLPAAILPASTLPGATPIGNGNVTTVPVASATNTPAAVAAAAPVTPLSGLTDQLGLAGLMPAGNPLASLLPTAATAAPAAAAPAAPAPVAASLTVPPALSPLSALP